MPWEWYQMSKGLGVPKRRHSQLCGQEWGSASEEKDHKTISLKMILEDKEEVGSWGAKLGKARLQTWVKQTPAAEFFFPGHITSPQLRRLTKPWFLCTYTLNRLAASVSPIINIIQECTLLCNIDYWYGREAFWGSGEIKWLCVYSGGQLQVVYFLLVNWLSTLSCWSCPAHVVTSDV